ncbi:hypothetical protein ANO14919_048520 [Xylariales sp. No.14919]|nr:hypothetical protein ANO14919_048520 [Xylariales sp. No.14919]
MNSPLVASRLHHFILAEWRVYVLHEPSGSTPTATGAALDTGDNVPTVGVLPLANMPGMYAKDNQSSFRIHV